MTEIEKTRAALNLLYGQPAAVCLIGGRFDHVGIVSVLNDEAFLLGSKVIALADVERIIPVDPEDWFALQDAALDACMADA